MKYRVSVLALALMLALTACQPGPSAQTPPPAPAGQADVSSASLGAGGGELKWEIVDGEKSLRIQAQVAPMPAQCYTFDVMTSAFADTAAAAKLFLGAEDVQREQRFPFEERPELDWPYPAEEPWMEKYTLGQDSLQFSHGLGTIDGAKIRGADVTEGWQAEGDEDGDGLAQGLEVSREQCESQARSFLEALGLQPSLYHTAVLDTQPAYPCYAFFYTFLYEGLPSTYNIPSSVQELTHSDISRRGAGAEVYVDKDGIFNVHVLAYTPLSQERTPVEILPAERVLPAVEEAAKYYWEFSPLSLPKDISRVELCYMPDAHPQDEGFTQDKIQLMRRMRPVWCFSSGPRWGAVSQTQIYVDAVTGEWIQ